MTGFWTWARPCCDWFAPCDHPRPLRPAVRLLRPIVRSFYDWPTIPPFRWSQVGRNLVVSLVWLGLKVDGHVQNWSCHHTTGGTTNRLLTDIIKRGYVSVVQVTPHTTPDVIGRRIPRLIVRSIVGGHDWSYGLSLWLPLVVRFSTIWSCPWSSPIVVDLANTRTTNRTMTYHHQKRPIAVCAGNFFSREDMPCVHTLHTLVCPQVTFSPLHPCFPCFALRIHIRTIQTWRRHCVFFDLTLSSSPLYLSLGYLAVFFL